MGDSASAVRTLKKAAGLIQPERDPRLVLCIRHNLADNLSKMGRHTEAAGLLPEFRELAAAHGGALDHLRLRWVEGRVAAGLGEYERARQLLGCCLQSSRSPREALAAVLFFYEAAP